MLPFCSAPTQLMMPYYNSLFSKILLCKIPDKLQNSVIITNNYSKQKLWSTALYNSFFTSQVPYVTIIFINFVVSILTFILKQPPLSPLSLSTQNLITAILFTTTSQNLK